MVFEKETKCVVCIVQNGKALVEDINTGIVPIKFGTEFKIRLRNRNSRDIIAKLFVKGENVSAGGFLVPAKSAIDIEHPADNNKKFKFVSLDSSEAIEFGENHDRSECVIEAQFHFVKEQQKVKVVEKVVHEHHYHSYPYYVQPYTHISPMWTLRGLSGGVSYGVTTGTLSAQNMSAANETFCSNTVSQNTPIAAPGGSCDFDCDEAASVPCAATPTTSPLDSLANGAVIEGGYSGQTFVTRDLDYEDSYSTARLILKGYDENSEPIKIINTVKTTVSKSTDTQKRIAELKFKKAELELKLLEQETAKLEAQVNS